MDIVEKYARRARDLSKDPELGARAAFLGAQAEQGRYAARPDYDTWNPGDAVQSPTWFGVLKDEYSNTRYFDEIVRECGYFRRYLGR